MLKMESLKEKAREYAISISPYSQEHSETWDIDTEKGFIQGAKYKWDSDKEIIEMLIDMLQTSKNYHLGITALDTEQEILEKRRTGETALIRNIESKINRAKRYIEKNGTVE